MNSQKARFSIYIQKNNAKTMWFSHYVDMLTHTLALYPEAFNAHT